MAESRPRHIASQLATRVNSQSGALRDRTASWLPIRVLHRFAAIDGKNKTLILAGQAFTAVIPLLMVIASIGAQAHEQNKLAGNLIHRFSLNGEAASAMHAFFSRPPGTAGGIGLVGVALLLFSVLTFAKVLQVTFETAWGLPSGGFRRNLYGLSATAVLVGELTALTLLASLVRGIPGGTAVNLVVRVASSVLFWVAMQYVLLSGRIGWRSLVPGAVLGGVGQVLVSLASTAYMPNLIATNSSRYGIVGVALALLSWLIVLAGAIVASAVAGPELAGRPPLRPRRRDAESAPSRLP